MTQMMENQVHLFKMQLHYIAQACIQSHACHVRQEMQQPTQSQLQLSSHLSMVTKVDGRAQLTNPYFKIEECIDQLYVLFMTVTRALTSFLPDYRTVAQFCPPPVLPKKSKKSSKLTLVLDLDETLIHVSLKQMHENDKQITLSNGTNDVTVNCLLLLRST